MVSSALPAGAVIAGRYLIVEPIGRGGMATVYEALDRDSIRALKVMDRAMVEDPDWRARFDQEARIGSSLRGKHLTEVLEHGVDSETGLPYLVMERLHGEDLEALIERRGRLDVREARRVLRELCDAVGTAHAAGVVHRDLKPNNVFLTRSGDVKVLDFGIAKVLTEWRSTVTRAMGTPGWMAPEQLQTGGNIGPPTDVWAIGLLAFYMLTGRAYWRGFDKTQDWRAMTQEILLDPLAPASDRAASYGVFDLPSDFDAWFSRCVHRDPAARFLNAQDAQTALDPVMKIKLLKTPVPPSVTSTGAVSGVTVRAEPLMDALSPTSPVDPDEAERLALATAAAELSRRVQAALERERQSSPPATPEPQVELEKKKTKKAPKDDSSRTSTPPKVVVQPDAGAAVKDPARGSDGSRTLFLLVALAAIFAIAYLYFAKDEKPSPPVPTGAGTITITNTNRATPTTVLTPEPLVPSARPNWKTPSAK